MFTITDSATLITLTAAAITAGWTGNNTNTVTGPDTGLTALSLLLNDGADSLAGVSSPLPVSVTTSGTLTVSGAVSVTGDFGMFGYFEESGEDAASYTGEIDLGLGYGFQPLVIDEGEGGWWWEFDGSNYQTGPHLVTVRICNPNEMVREVFAPGASKRWDRLVIDATGEPLNATAFAQQLSSGS